MNLVHVAKKKDASVCLWITYMREGSLVMECQEVQKTIPVAAVDDAKSSDLVTKLAKSMSEFEKVIKQVATMFNEAGKLRHAATTAAEETEQV